MRRLLVGALVAVVLAGPVIAANNLLICKAYTPDQVEWYLFFCYLDGGR